MLKLPKMQFHEKKIFDLFDFTSFFAWTFLNFLAHYATSKHGSVLRNITDLFKCHAVLVWWLVELG